MHRSATTKFSSLQAEPVTGSSQREFELLRLCARTSIDPKTREKIGVQIGRGIDWDFAIRLAQQHRVVPVVYRTLSHSWLDQVPRTAMERLRSAFYANAKRNLFLTSELFQVVGLFERHDIPVIPYKGPVLAAVLYGEVSLRQFSDIDIIVPRKDLERATALLVARGYRPIDETPLNFTEKQKDLVLVREDVGIHLELHWGITIATDPLQVQPEFLWENLSSTSVGGKAVRINSPEDLLLILCIHGGKHRWEHLGWLCDISELLRSHPDLDWAALIDRASSIGGRRILLLGVLLARNLLDAALPDEVMREIEGDSVVTELANDVQRWLSTESAVALGETERYFIRLRESRTDKLRVAANQLKRYALPTSRDREVLALKGWPSAILYLIRPFRLAWEYGLQPLRSLLKGVFDSGSARCEVRKKAREVVKLNHQITDLSVVARMPEQVSCDLSGEAVILNLNSGIYYGMDEIGALIWNALDEPRTLEYIRDTILSDYQIDSDTCERDIVAFLAEMQSAGLIEINHEARV